MGRTGRSGWLADDAIWVTLLEAPAHDSELAVADSAQPDLGPRTDLPAVGRAVQVRLSFVTGSTPSADFPAAGGPGYDTSWNGYHDAFVVKLNPAGTALDYATFLGGSIDESGYSIAVDGAGHAYITGATGSSDFPAANGPGYDTSYSGAGDAFVVKLSADGMRLDYATFLGNSSGSSGGDGIAVDGTGHAYVTGNSASANFPAASGPGYDTSHNGGYDVFAVKLSAAGTGLDYATFIGGSGDDQGRRIAVDGMGQAYITGNTASANFPAASGPGYDTSYNGGDRDVFMVKLNAAGTALSYATFLGGSSSDHSLGIAVDGMEHAYIMGETFSPDSTAVNGPGYDTSWNGYYDVFVVKLATGEPGRLKPGWNLVSLHLVLANGAPDLVLASIAGKYDRVRL